MNNTLLIKALMKEYNITPTQMAAILNCSERTFTNKLYNRKKQNAKSDDDVCEFNSTEIKTIADTLNIGREQYCTYFFN